MSGNINTGVFSKACLIVGESAADYSELTRLVHNDIQPHGLHERLLVRDIVDAEWDIVRLRGLKAGMLDAAIPRVVMAQLAEDGGSPTDHAVQSPLIRKHVIGVLAGDGQARQALDKLLESHNLKLDSIIAAAFERNIMPQLHTERMVAEAYKRRNAAYAAIEAMRAREYRLAAGLDEVAGHDERDAHAAAKEPNPAAAATGAIHNGSSLDRAANGTAKQH